jgi:hypothetical protein
MRIILSYRVEWCENGGITNDRKFWKVKIQTLTAYDFQVFLNDVNKSS